VKRAQAGGRKTPFSGVTESTPEMTEHFEDKLVNSAWFSKKEAGRDQVESLRALNNWIQVEIEDNHKADHAHIKEAIKALVKGLLQELRKGATTSKLQ
jgi:hypothetical protein